MSWKRSKVRNVAHKPRWFRDGFVYVSHAETVGINKDGNELYKIDAATGTRTEDIDDRVAEDIAHLLVGDEGAHSRWVRSEDYSVGVPAYYSRAYHAPLDALLSKPAYRGFKARSLKSLIESGEIEARHGHGSPSADLRDGEVPYIKVSDIRAGQVNINPTNMVPRVVAERHWRSRSSGLKAFDLVTPVRASKNIGEFALLMPGQEDVVVTKEVLVLRPGKGSAADSFYLLWALSLRVTREQWKRVVFMQTNREDVGRRYLEIEIPWAPDKVAADKASESFRTYYSGIEKLRTQFVRSLEATHENYVFLGASTPEDASGTVNR